MRDRRWLWVLALVGLVVAAYWPALHAGWIWDDDSYVTNNPVVQTAEGIADAWVPGRTPQYYPLVFASFWVQHAVHGLDPFGYHLVNVLLHGLSAFLLWRLLLRLGVPGAGIAAAIWLLHPMQVESVAWVTERKNVLSMAFSLGAVLAWVRFADDDRPFAQKAGWWGLSFVLFACAMLSKTTAVAVPCALVAVELWRRRTIGARTIALVAPFFALGIVLGLNTARVEATLVGATGPEFDRSFLDRTLQAAQAWWFYLRTWFAPSEILFIHPPFDRGAFGWMAWLAVAGFLGICAAAWALWRRGKRGFALVLAMFTAGTFPALGFINVYPLRYSPVAEHFAYVGTVALAAGAGYLASRFMSSLRGLDRAWLGPVALAGLLLAFAFQTNRVAADYQDAETLWRATLARNPRAWIAANNLCHIAGQRADAAFRAGDKAAAERHVAEAAVLVEQAAREAGDWDMPLLGNLSEVRRMQGLYPEALEAIDKAIRLQPDFAGTRWQRARLLELMGRDAEAGREYQEAVRLGPTDRNSLRECTGWLVKQGRLAEARDLAARLAALDPQDPQGVVAVAQLSLELKDLPRARHQLEMALGMSDEPYRTMVAVRLVDACLTPPTDAESLDRAVRVAEGVVQVTGARDPLALLLLARALALADRPADARTVLARADALPAPADPEAAAALKSERDRVQAALAGR
jgi:tetratricopeptide (TPR) repeat protein